MTNTQTVNSAASADSAVKIYSTGGTQVNALDNVSVEFETGKFTAIMGPSGSGKSTLMHCMAGLDRLTSGEVFVGDENITNMKEKDLTLLRRNNIGFVFQAFNLVPTLSAYENITLPMQLGKTEVDEGYLSEVVKAVGLENRMGHKPAELSGGQQQRVAVARALASKPAVIFADEPTGNLDSTTGAEILQFMKDAVDGYGQTIVMVTHSPTAAAYSDRVIFLADGKIVNEIIDPNRESILHALSEASE